MRSTRAAVPIGYEGSAKGVEWICNKVSGGADMASDATRLFGPKK